MLLRVKYRAYKAQGLLYLGVRKDANAFITYLFVYNLLVKNVFKRIFIVFGLLTLLLYGFLLFREMKGCSFKKENYPITRQVGDFGEPMGYMLPPTCTETFLMVTQEFLKLPGETLSTLYSITFGRAALVKKSTYNMSTQ